MSDKNIHMPRRSAAPDTNARVAAALRDMAAAKKPQQSRWGYERAAEAIAGLPEPIESYLRNDGTLRKIPNVGPSSERVVLEVLRTGGSPTVTKAIAERHGPREIEKRADADGTFLTSAEVAAALKNRRLRGVTLADYRGDLQMHSTFSDGTQTLDDIVETGLTRGYTHAAVTDHYGLKVANGLTMARLQDQHAAIDRLNARYAGRFRVIKGIEANILADGGLDMSRDDRRQVELVVAAPHSALRTSADQTRRLLSAVKAPGVHILGHPRGRKHGVRAGLTADWDRIFEAAARATVAIEIDGDPRRQDIDHTLARRALEAGCIFALDSDAHAIDEWAFAENAVAHARLAGIPGERVINTWPADFLLEWAAGLTG